MTLSQLLMTRFCHDISGALGAIYNGVEFIEEAGGMEEGAFSLIASSARDTMARLQYYRYAYGQLKESQPVDLAEKQAMIADFYAQSRLHMQWDMPQHDGLPPALWPRDCQILVCLLLLASGMLIRGGTVRIQCVSSEATTEDGRPVIQRITIAGKGKTVKTDEAMMQALRGELAGEPDTKTILACYTYLLASERMGGITAATGEQTLSLDYYTESSTQGWERHYG